MTTTRLRNMGERRILSVPGALQSLPSHRVQWGGRTWEAIVAGGILIDQMLDPRFRSLRKVYYDFHFNGLDIFVEETETAQQNVLDALKSLDELYDSVSRQYVLDIFFTTKADEIAAIFEESPLSSEAFNLLSRVDPANLSKYEKLVN